MALDGQVALITGASAGIGLATAEALAGKGVKLMLHGRRQDKLNEIAAKLPNCAVRAGDLMAEGEPEALFAATLETHGNIDIVFNNAGIMYNGPIETIDIDGMCRMVRMNVETAFRVAYLAMRRFRSQNSGQLVNTSSVLGLKSRAYSGAYAGTKHAIEALMEGLRMETAGSPIRVICVEPGLVRTELHRDFAERPEKAQNIDRILDPEDIARAIMFALEQPPHVLVPQVVVMPKEAAF